MDSKAQIQHRLNLITFYRSKIEEHNRPYNIAIDICEKQIVNIIEKDIKSFFLFDINFINNPTKEQEESVEKLGDLAREVGIIPISSEKSKSLYNYELHEILVALQFLEDIKNLPKEYKNGQ